MNRMRAIIRSAMRLLAHAPGLSSAVILTLGLGIGATTAIFSVFHAVLLDPLPFQQPERLVSVWEVDQRSGEDRNPVSSGNFMDWRDDNQAFDAIGAYSWNFPLTVTGAGVPARITAARVTPGLFETLGVSPMLGAGLTADPQASDEYWVMISHDFWRSHFGSNPDAPGMTVSLDERTARVAGVMPESLEFPSPQTQVWLPVRLDEEDRQQRKSHQWRVVARLKDGVTIERAQQNMRLLAEEIARRHPVEMEGFGVRLVSLHADLVQQSETMLWILLGVVALTLLIACTNAAGLMLTRAVAQRHELAVRSALGANRGQIAGHVMGECLTLGALGGAVGILLALAGIRFLVAVGPAEVPRLAHAGLNAEVLSFALAMTMLTVILVGLLPAMRAARVDPASALAAGGRVGAGRTLTLRRGLIVSEIALACVLVIGAALLVHSFIRLLNVDAGFRTADMLVAGVSLPHSRYPENPEQLRFFAEAIEELERIPGVDAVAGTPEGPIIGPNNTFSFMIEGRPRPGANPREDPVPLRAVTTSYFETMGIPLLSGRGFSDRDRSDSPPVLVINETFARRFWPDGQAVGKRITRQGPEGPWMEIVGVVGDTRHYGLDKPTPPAMYIPVAQKPWSWMSWMAFMIRTRPGTEVSPDAIREAVSRVDDQVAVSGIRSLQEVLDASNARRRFATLLLSAFGAVAAFLSLVGVYGVLAYTVVQRTGELGLRMALGAAPGTVAMRVLAGGLKLTLLGLGLGLAGAVAFGQALRSQLFDVSPLDPVAFLSAPILLALAAMAAALIPALRAGRTSPAEALRYE